VNSHHLSTRRSNRNPPSAGGNPSGSRPEPHARRGVARVEREREARRAARSVPPASGPSSSPTVPAAPHYEAEVVPGLEALAQEELRALLGSRLRVQPGSQPGTLTFQSRVEAQLLLSLGLTAAIYRVHRFEVPRPRALLGEEHLQTLLRLLDGVRSLHPPESFRSFRFSAAGATSGVFTRLSAELSRRSGLVAAPEDGDLLIRVRPAAVDPHQPGELGQAGFEVLVRLTPRPLTARPWRVCNLPGALNATVARAMAVLTAPAPHDRVLNLACGSGTLMIERLALGPARLVVGADRDPVALACAARNLRAAGRADRARLLRAEAGRLPLADAAVNVLCADLPFGMRMGSRGDNERLYPALLAEATRVAAPGAAMVLITHAVRALEGALETCRGHWLTERRQEVQLSYQSGVIRPQIWLLRRASPRGTRR
jgi:tRNA (guanine6-N2)-methyltransferase